MKQSTCSCVLYKMEVLLMQVLCQSEVCALPLLISMASQGMCVSCSIFDFPDFSGWPRNV
jgi:hypothetical protein